MALQNIELRGLVYRLKEVKRGRIYFLEIIAILKKNNCFGCRIVYRLANSSKTKQEKNLSNVFRELYVLMIYG